MPVLPVMQAQPGDRLAFDVQTALGSVLMEKGRAVSERDLEILQAFLIPTVDIRRTGLEEKEADAEWDEAAAPQEMKLSSLQQQFLEMERLLKRTMSMVVSGPKIPVLDLRNGLSSLLKYKDDYNVLTFLLPPYGGTTDRGSSRTTNANDTA